MEIILALFFLLFILAVITVVGHGIWALLAFIIRTIVGKPPSQPQQNRITESSPGGKLDVLSRQLYAWRQQGKLEAKQYEELANLVRQERLLLAGEGSHAEEIPSVEPVSADATEGIEFVIPEETETNTVLAADDEIVTAEVVEAELVEAVDQTPVPSAKPPKLPHALDPFDIPEEAETAAAAENLRGRASRTLADVLQSFMEEKNIRWGEIVSGMLIVGSAVGLVVSLWATLRDAIPYFPALLFMLLTAAIYGAGIYSLRKWKVESISRSVLVIVLLLVPLNFLAAIVLNQKDARPLFDPLYLTAVVVGLLVFGGIAYSASRELLRNYVWRLPVGILVAALGQLVVARLAGAGMSLALVVGLSVLPLIALAAALVVDFIGPVRNRISIKSAGERTIVLGISLFSFAAPLVLLVTRADDALQTLGQLSPALSVAAALVLAAGLALYRGATRPQLVAWRVTGAAIAFLAGMVMLGSVALAWPAPVLLLAVGLLCGTTLAVLGHFARFPWLHPLSAAALGLASVTAYHLWQGNLPWQGEFTSVELIRVLRGIDSAYILTILAVIPTAAAFALQQRARFAQAGSWLAGAGLLAGISILIGLWAGFVEQSPWATWLLLLYAIAILAVNFRLALPVVSWIGSTLLLIALCHSLAVNFHIQEWLGEWESQRPVLVAAILHGLFCMLATVVSQTWRRMRTSENSHLHSHAIAPLWQSALLTSLAATPFALWVIELDYSFAAGATACIALIWLAVALLNRWPAMFAAFQAIASVALFYATTAAGMNWNWTDGAVPDTAFLPLQLLVLAVWCLGWSLLRKGLPAAAQELLRPAASGSSASLTVDEALLAGLVIASGLFACWGIWPGIEAELGVFSGHASLAEKVDLSLARMEVFSGTHWLALLAMLFALAAAWWEKPNAGSLLCGALATATVALLSAGWFLEPIAAASAVRFGLAIHAVAWACLVCCRRPLQQLAEQIVPRAESDPLGTQLVRFTALLLAAPVLLLTLSAVFQNLQGQTFGGPLEGTFFSNIGPTASYLLPLLALVGVLVAYAVREKQAAYAAAGSVLSQIVVTLAVLLAGPERLDIALWQWNTAGLAGYLLLWLALRRWIAPGQSAGWSLLDLQAAAMTVALACIAGQTAWILFVDPQGVHPSLAALGQWPGYAAWALSTAAGLWFIFVRQKESLFGAIALLLAFLLPTVSVSIDLSTLSPTDWAGFHVLSIGWLALALITVASSLAIKLRTSAEGLQFASRSLGWFSALLSLLVTLLALRGSDSDAWTWNPASLVLGVAAVHALLALRGRRQGWAYSSTAAVGLAGILLAVAGAWSWLRWEDEFLMMLCSTTAAVCLAAWGWLLLEVWFQQKQGESFDPKWRLPFVHGAAAVLAACSLSFVLLFCGGLTTLALGLGGSTNSDISSLGSALALVVFGVLAASSLWDRYARLAISLLYLLGWLAIAWGLNQLEQTPLLPAARTDSVLAAQCTVVSWGLAAGAYLALTGHLWRFGANLAAWGRRLGVVDPVAGLERTSRWLPAATLFVASLIVLLEFGVVLAMPLREMRYTAALAPLLAAYGVASLAQQRRTAPMQLIALVLGGVAAVFAGWADLTPGHQAQLTLERAARLLISLAAVSFLYGAVAPWQLKERSPSWLASARRAAGLFMGTSLLVLLATLALEWHYFVPGEGVPFRSPYQWITVVVVLVGLIAALLALALSPARDPLKLSERGRQAYVYTAQVVAGLLFAHLYLSQPQLFEGMFRPWWPFIVVAIAMASVGAGELFRRRNLNVLGEPFQRCGVFLPLLPALAFWVVSSENMFSYQANGVSYAAVLFTVGLVYVLYSFLRQSFAGGAAAALAGNGALWMLLVDHDFRLAANPQLWMIPPAVSVLAAAQINRRRLGEPALAAIRYASLLVIYLSSTGELFIRGVGESLWPPMALAGLSVLGVLAGIVLQVRAFLYAGTTFLFMAIISMVWHASRAIEHVWPWWAFGIGLGLAILILFGVFEKKRSEIQSLVERLRQWEA